MPLASGVRLGPFEILARLGAGGMGDVYQARDTRLQRLVAIKVLADDLAGLPDVRQRFEREARAVSGLNHPHICSLFDIGHDSGIDFLVMEYLEGETLSKRLEKGPLPLELVLRHGIQISQALAQAHAQGILHRDLKPGNVMLTSSGAKLLDFGLAKFAQRTQESANESASVETLTSHGAIVGTVPYMAPEQLEAKAVDIRTDIFSLGAVLYEMVAGRRAFQGDTVPSLTASILFGTPEPLSIETSHGAALEHLVLKCLAKNPDDRWQSCRDVTTELEWLRDSSGARAPRMFSAVAPSMGGKSRERLLWSALAVSFVLAVVFGTFLLQQQIPETRAVRFLVAPPESTTLSGSFGVSPDGAALAFVATTDDGASSLYVRPLDSLVARRLPGTEGARHPFWSPDNRFIGFFAEGKLKKIRSDGGPPQSLATVFDARGGTWNRDRVIVFAPNVGDRLYRINEDGSGLAPVTTLEHSREESSHQWPRFLPDGHHFLFLVWSAQSEARGVYVASLESPDRERLVSADWGAIHAKGGEGNEYLLFLRGGSLMGQAFDTQKLSLSGEPFPLAGDVWFDQTAPGLSSFSSSENGVLAYRTGGIRTTQLTWYDSMGKSLGTIGEPGAFRDPALSPDGRRIVVARIDDETGTQDLWLFDPSRDVASRFTFHPANEVIPIWSPDGGQIVFSSDRSGVPDLYQKISSGTAPEQLVIESNVSKYATDWTRDGRYVIYANWDAETSWDLWTLRVEDKEAVAYLRSGFDEFQAQFSPDGRFVAYSSNESGRYEVYVQRFPMSSGKWQISTNGGSQPQWRSDGEVLFYLAPDLRLTGVELNASASGIDPSLPEALFPMKVTGLVDARNHFAVTENGKRFLVSTLLEKPGSSNMAVVLNWSTQLER